MNTKRWLLASVAVFVVIMALEFVIHGVLLAGTYQQTASVWRPQAEMQRLMWIFWVGYLVFAPFFAFIYAKGYEKGKPGLGQGIRFGFYVGAMLSVMHSFGQYVVTADTAGTVLLLVRGDTRGVHRGGHRGGPRVPPGLTGNARRGGVN